MNPLVRAAVHSAGNEEVVVLELCRAPKLNAINDAMLDELDVALNRIVSNPRRAVVITGDGDTAFCAGADLQDVALLDEDRFIERNQKARAVFARLNRLPVISVAALNGVALGGGLELALSCTFRIAAPSARLGLPEIKLGVMPTYGGTQLLPKLVGPSVALEMMLSGEPIDAMRAAELGIVSAVAPTDAELLDTALEFAAKVGRYGLVAQSAIRTAIDGGHGRRPDDPRLADDLARRVFRSVDASEGIKAFLQKRPPNFTDN